MSRPHVRTTALGALALALGTLGTLPATASAETCSATSTDAACGPADVSAAPGEDYATARADDDGVGSAAGAFNGLVGDDERGAGAGSSSARGGDEPGAGASAAQSTPTAAAAGSTSTTADGDPATRYVEGGTVDDDRAYTAFAPGERPEGATVRGTADVSATGPRSGASAAESESSRARSTAAGPDARAVSAAVEQSSATARADGDRSSAGAAATDHSDATATAAGTGSTARAVAVDHDRAFALAQRGGTADVSPTRAHCRGGIAYGYELRSPSVCASVGPVGVGFSGRTGTDIGIGGVDLTGVGGGLVPTLPPLPGTGQPGGDQGGHDGRDEHHDKDHGEHDSGHTRDGDDHEGRHRA